MNDNQRRVVAYIAGRLASGKHSGYLYDFQGNGFSNYSGTIDNSRVSIYDYATSNYVTGNSRGDFNFSLYDYKLGSYIDLKLSGNRFNGYSYGSSSFFDGTVNMNGAVSMYDYGTRRFYNYQV